MTEQQLSIPVQEASKEAPKEQTATMCRTKAGNGFKFVVDGLWFYTSKDQVMELIDGRAKACTFHTITD